MVYSARFDVGIHGYIVVGLLPEKCKLRLSSAYVLFSMEISVCTYRCENKCPNSLNIAEHRKTTLKRTKCVNNAAHSGSPVCDTGGLYEFLLWHFTLIISVPYIRIYLWSACDMKSGLLMPY